MKLEQPHDPHAAPAASVHLAAMNAGADEFDYQRRLLQAAAAESDRQADLQQRQLRTAWRVAGGMAGCALLSLLVAGGAVLSALRPAPDPRILLLDGAEGRTRPLMSLSEYQLKPQDATIRRYVATFLRACENYSADTAQDNYYDCAALLSPPLRAQWESRWDLANPESPLNLYKKEARVRVEAGAITILRNNQGVATGARVTFTRAVSHSGQPDPHPTNWIATISYHWVNAPSSERQRRVNDLGWEVTEYSTDPDVGPAPRLGAAPAVPATPARGDAVATVPAQVTP